jgi:hypothetical protein
MKQLIKGFKYSLLALLLPLAPIAIEAATQQAQIDTTSDWQEFHSVTGKCKMKFPSYPQHVTENMKFQEGYDLRYDAYVSAINKETVYMLLVAQYPDFVDQTYARMSLEGFLNGILSHNQNNQLLFADLVLVDGYEALDFFIRTGTVYFKGRAMMVKNSLYLMVMECEMKGYNETEYNSFISSFKLAK